jgi:hypothetical protein
MRYKLGYCHFPNTFILIILVESCRQLNLNRRLCLYTLFEVEFFKSMAEIIGVGQNEQETKVV